MLIDLSSVKDQSFEPIPQGEYTLVCVNAEINENKKGTGEYIKCEFEVDGGEQNGRKVFHMFNIKNENVKAVEIGLGQLKTFLKMAGKNDSGINDVNELIGLKSNAVLKIRKSDEYGDQSVISYFKPLKVQPPAFNASENVPF